MDLKTSDPWWGVTAALAVLTFLLWFVLYRPVAYALPFFLALEYSGLTAVFISGVAILWGIRGRRGRRWAALRWSLQVAALAALLFFGIVGFLAPVATRWRQAFLETPFEESGAILQWYQALVAGWQSYDAILKRSLLAAAVLVGLVVLGTILAARLKWPASRSLVWTSFAALGVAALLLHGDFAEEMEEYRQGRRMYPESTREQYLFEARVARQRVAEHLARQRLLQEVEGLQPAEVNWLRSVILGAAGLPDRLKRRAELLPYLELLNEHRDFPGSDSWRLGMGFELGNALSRENAVPWVERRRRLEHLANLWSARLDLTIDPWYQWRDIGDLVDHPRLRRPMLERLEEAISCRSSVQYVDYPDSIEPDVVHKLALPARPIGGLMVGSLFHGFEEAAVQEVFLPVVNRAVANRLLVMAPGHVASQLADEGLRDIPGRLILPEDLTALVTLEGLLQEVEEARAQSALRKGQILKEGVELRQGLRE